MKRELQRRDWGWRRWWALGALLAAAPLHALELSRPALSGDLGFGYDSNVSNSQAEDPTRDSSLLMGALHAGYTHELGVNTGVLARGSLQGEAVEAYEGLTNAKLAGLVRVSHRPGGGFYTPTLSLGASAALWEFDSRIRDSTEYRVIGLVSESLTTLISGRLSLGAAWRDSDSEVFDLRSQSLGLDLDWRVAPLLTVYGGYQFRHGDVVSSSSLTGAKAAIVDPKTNHTYLATSAAEAIEADDAFGSLAEGEFAYRLDADTHVGTLGFNRPLSPMLSLDAQVQAVRSDAGGGIRYDRWIGVASVLARF